MQSRCACAVVAGASACPALENLHVCTAQSHGMGVLTVCTSSKSGTPPRRATLVARRGQRTPPQRRRGIDNDESVLAELVKLSN